ncbi:hypothetical protein TNCV_2418351 [Trichonephila clavipes]|nr:hypothetical protein TNCV_2418351 [Trichonephila clavipes]
MSRRPDQVVNLKRALPSPQASLVLIYRLTAVGMKGSVDLARPEDKTQTCGEEARYATIRQLGLKIRTYADIICL